MPLATRVQSRMARAYRPGTCDNLTSMFNTFLAYIIFYDIDLSQLSVPHILGFIETLAISQISMATIKNYISALRATFHRYSIPTLVLHHRDIQLMLRSCSITIIGNPKVKHIFSLQILTQIILKCHTLDHPCLYRAIYLFAFFGFFRISNLVPSSFKAYEITKHLARGDIFVAPPGLQVLLKWSKTMQTGKSYKAVPMAAISNSNLCPVAAFNALSHHHPVSPNSPMFAFFGHSGLETITQQQVRSHLRSIMLLMGLNPISHTFHTFRRSGASLAFQLRVPIQDIQSHGTWLSDAVWTYIQPSLTDTAVPTAFANHIQHSLGLGEF